MKERFGKSSKQKQPEEEQLSTAHPSISDGKKAIFQWKRWGILHFL